MTTLTAFLDLAVCPVSFDAIVFLVKAEIERKRIGAERMHVVIVPFAGGVAGMFRDKSKFYDEHEARFRLWNILMPACQLFGASVTLAGDWLQAKRIASDKDWKCWPPDWDRQSLKDRRHLIGDVITAARAGTAVPRLQASVHARRKVREGCAKLGRPLVTLTLRQTYLPERNANRAAWESLRRHVENSGYATAMIEDTNVALSHGRGFAELNLDLRMAMYSEAVCNLHSNGGAGGLSWFSDRPYLFFDAGIPASEWEELFVNQGLPLLNNWPWAGPQQKLVYRPATFEIMREEFEVWRTASA